MDNLELYNKVRSVPESACKSIQAGRLKGKTDINPMWRIKTLTEQFGPCGKGWYYRITDKRFEFAEQTGETAAFVDIELYVKFGEEWSQAVVGTGGSMFVAAEKNGLHVSDECFKMALTDAISVACKALGVGADVYWDKDDSKYTDSLPDDESGESEAERKELPSDVLSMSGADKADNKTLFMNALKRGKIEIKAGRSLLDSMFGDGVMINTLTRDDLIAALNELDKMVI